MKPGFWNVCVNLHQQQQQSIFWEIYSNPGLYNMCQPAPNEICVNLHQRQQGRTWRGGGRRAERNCSRRIQSHLIQHLSSKLSIFDLRTNCFTNNIQGVFFTWPPPEFAKCWPVSNWFQKNVRVPDWPPLWKHLSVWRSECDSNT